MELGDNLDDFMDELLNEGKKLQQKVKAEEDFQEQVYTSSLFLDNALDMTLPKGKLSPEQQKYANKKWAQGHDIMRLYNMLKSGEVTYEELKDILVQKSDEESGMGMISLAMLAEVPDSISAYRDALKTLNTVKEDPELSKEPIDLRKQDKSLPEVYDENVKLLTEAVSEENFFTETLPGLAGASIGWNLKKRFGFNK